MKYKDYTVHSEFCSDKSIHWRVTGNGEYILGDKGAETFFIKRNIHIRYPTKNLSKELYSKYLKDAKSLEGKQEKLKSLMKDLNWSKDHILIEERNFWDDEGLFTTVTHFVDNCLSYDYDFSKITTKEFLQLALDSSKLFKALHNCKVIHGDVKEKNFLIQKKDGKYIPYLIDFDSSYSVSEIPSFDNIGGTDGYLSPEVLEYSILEHEEAKRNILTKVDVFALGIVFHRWWTNSFPGVDEESASVGAAIYLEKEIIINDKFNFKIGSNMKATFKSLLNWMLIKDVSQRASIDDVIDVLEDKRSIPHKFVIGNDYNPFDKDLWKSHRRYAKLFSIEELHCKNIVSFKRYNTGVGSSGLKYYIKTKETEELLTIDEVIDRGYAERLPIIIDSPWEEHKLEFEPAAVILSKGYFEIKKTILLGIRKYLITDKNGRKIDCGCEWLVNQGLAHLKKIEIESDTPWPEHGLRYNNQTLGKLGVKKISRIEVGGEHRYKIIYFEITDGENLVQESVSVNNLKLMGFIE